MFMSLKNSRRKIFFAAITSLIFAAAISLLPLEAQQRGPIKPPPSPAPPVAATTPDSSSPAPASGTAPAAAKPADSTAPAMRERTASGIRNEPPAMPVEEVIKKFGDHERDFKTERENYTYTQTVVVQTIDVDGRPDGEYKMTSDIVFTPEGKRYEKVTYAPQSTLERISLTPEDMADLQNVQPFVLTTDDLPKYDVKYVGREHLDELDTYVFDVGPKKLEKGQRYFQGRIWVEDKDLAVVKTFGKAVPDIRSKGGENVFPKFETFRENIEKDYWFPTLTRADDALHFATGDIRMRMTVRYSNYKRFGVKIQIKADPNHK
jgi:hypothetical protein